MAATFTYDETGPIKKILMAWTSTGAGSALGISKKIVGRLLRVVTVPDGTAVPTDNYDIQITDEEGVDVLAVCEDDLTDRDTADTEEIQCIVKNYSLVPIGVGLRPVVCDKLSIVVSAAGDTKQGQVIIYWK